MLYPLFQHFWEKKIEDRLKNLRRLASRKRKKRLEIETGKRQPKGKPGRKKKEKASSAVPSLPEGETEESIDQQVEELKDIYRERNGAIDLGRVREIMDNTFARRRQAVIEQNERVWKVLQDYPAFKDNKGNEASTIKLCH